MGKSTGVVRPVRTFESGRILTSEEAELLQQYLLDTKPLIIVGNEGSYIHQKHVDAKKNTFGK